VTRHGEAALLENPHGRDIVLRDTSVQRPKIRRSSIWVIEPAVSTLRRRSDDITRGLEAIKQTLAGLSASDLAREQTDMISLELTAIRVQLRRMSVDQQAFSDELARRISEAP
jgi:hypothetical protein